MGFLNPGFEEAGASPGEALGWTQNSNATAVEIAPWGANNLEIEGFEDGFDNDNYVYIFAQGSFEAAVFDGDLTVENFESEWDSNEGYILAPNDASWEAAIFGSLLEDMETFEREWDDNQDYILLPAGMTIVAAQFGSGLEDVEAFDSEWDNNENYEWTWDQLIGKERAHWDNNPMVEYRETFEGVVNLEVPTTPGNNGAALDISESHWVEVEFSGTFVGSFQVQARYDSTWQDVGSPVILTATRVILPDNRNQVRVNCISYTSGAPVASYYWGEAPTLGY